MSLRKTNPRLFIFLLLPVLLLVFACSMPSWFPIKKGPPHMAKQKELLDKEVIIIDKHEYVKVLNTRASEGKDQPKYLYIPVNEYLSNMGAYATPAIKKEEFKREPSVALTKTSSSLEEEVLLVSPSKPALSGLKKKVMIAHFDDRTTVTEEVLGDWVAEKLMKEVNRRSYQVSFVDYQMVKEFLEKKGTDLKDLETPNVLHLLNEVFGIHALVVGQLSGPYVFATKTDKNTEGTASAIIKIDMRLVDTISGKTIYLPAIPSSPQKKKGLFRKRRPKSGRSISLSLNWDDPSQQNWIAWIGFVESPRLRMKRFTSMLED